MSIAGEPTSGLEPLTSSHYECALIRSWVFLTVPKTAYLSHLCLFRVSLCSPSFARATVTVTVKPLQLCNGAQLPTFFCSFRSRALLVSTLLAHFLSSSMVRPGCEAALPTQAPG